MRSTRYGGRIVLKPFRVCAIVVALMTVGDGVAAADPMKIPDVNQYVDTMDGWRLNASLTDVTINPVANMAATAFSREGFVSGRATEVIEGTSSVPVKEGTPHTVGAVRLPDRSARRGVLRQHHDKSAWKFP